MNHRFDACRKQSSRVSPSRIADAKGLIPFSRITVGWYLNRTTEFSSYKGSYVVVTVRTFPSRHKIALFHGHAYAYLKREGGAGCEYRGCSQRPRGLKR